MKYTSFKNVKSDKGLTLVELLAVIVILGIIAAIAVPAIGKIIENNRIKATKSEAIIAMEAAKLYFVEHQIHVVWETAPIPKLIKEGYMSGGGYLNDTSFVISTNPPTICAAATDTNKGGKASRVKFVNASADDIAKSKNRTQVGKVGVTCGDQELKLDPEED